MQKFTYRNPKILAHANGQQCQNCGCNDGTVVACHSNQQEHGKGRGIKAHDVFVAFLCGNCHYWLDFGTGKDPTVLYNSNRTEKNEMFTRAFQKTLLILLKDGVLK